MRHLSAAAVAVAATLFSVTASRLGAVEVGDQADSAGTFADEAARRLYESAAAARGRLNDALVSYTAVVRQRAGAALRMPLKDRSLYRSESAHRVFWSRDGDVLVQVLGLREETPMGLKHGNVHLGVFDDNYDPSNDALMFGLVPSDDEMYEEDRHDFWIAHPLDPEQRDGYRFTVGDTLTLSLPDGRQVRVVELEVVPTEVDVHRITGSLWIEPGTGSLVRAAYRLSDGFDAMRDLPDLREEDERGEFKYVPPLFKPWTAEIRMISVDYARWGDGLWLPRSLHGEGEVRAGILHAPASMDLTYTFESVVTEADLAADDASEQELAFEDRDQALEALSEATVGDIPYRMSNRMSRRGPRAREKRVRYLVPEDPDVLLESDDLPPPVGEAAAGFATEDEVRSLVDGLAELPEAPQAGMPHTFRWGVQRPDLLRYNRVEGVSVGARGQIRPETLLGPLSVTATARLGSADLQPNLRVDVTRETLLRSITWSAYTELAAVDEDARHLGPGNSITALLFGRDEGDYYRREGTSLEWTPPSAVRRSFRVRAFAQYERPATAETDFSLWHVADSAWVFRDDLVADRGWETGGEVTVSPWWGSDPRSPQAGLDLTVRGAGGTWSYARASLTGRAALPLFSDLRAGFMAGGGTSWGDPPAQRLWAVGGASTLRGYAPRAQVGTTYLLGRAELARQFAFGAVSVFGDGAWAGDRNAIRFDDALLSVGVGLSLVDGLIRLDGAWGLRGAKDFRFEAYLDGIL